MARINFRDTAGFVTDGPGETYCLEETYPVSRGGFSFGWSGGSMFGLGLDRSAAAPSPKFAGLIQVPSGLTRTFTIDLPSTGLKDIRLALGDFAGAKNTTVTLYDDVTQIASFSVATASGQFSDATGAVVPAAAWESANAAITHDFASLTLNIEVSGTSGTAGGIAHVSVEGVAQTVSGSAAGDSSAAADAGIVIPEAPSGTALGTSSGSADAAITIPLTVIYNSGAFGNNSTAVVYATASFTSLSDGGSADGTSTLTGDAVAIPPPIIEFGAGSPAGDATAASDPDLTVYAEQEAVGTSDATATATVGTIVLLVADSQSLGSMTGDVLVNLLVDAGASGSSSASLNTDGVFDADGFAEGLSSFIGDLDLFVTGTQLAEGTSQAAAVPAVGGEIPVSVFGDAVGNSSLTAVALLVYEQPASSADGDSSATLNVSLTSIGVDGTAFSGSALLGQPVLIVAPVVNLTSSGAASAAVTLLREVAAVSADGSSTLTVGEIATQVPTSGSAQGDSGIQGVPVAFQASDEKFALYLDRRVASDSPFVTETVGGGFTTWTLPYSVATDGSEGVLTVVRQNSLTPLVVTRPSATQVQAVGDYSQVPVYIGVLYNFKYTPSRIYLRDDVRRPETRGRLNLRFLNIHYTDTTDLTVTVTLDGRSPRVYTLDNPVGTIQTGQLTVPIMGRNTYATVEIESTSAGPIFVSGLDWDGTYSLRGEAL